MSSGFVGTIFCWATGIAICVCAVAFSLHGGFLTKACGLMLLLAGAIVCGLARTATARWKLRFAAVTITSCIVMLLAEVGLRLTTKYPIDLHCETTANSELGYVLDSHSAEVDANGFRNVSVPESADIVTIGDSHTQGINVLPEESWPGQLATQLGQTVYNMGVQGYGPLQYNKLVTQALAFRPKHVVIGLNMADDLSDVVKGITTQHTNTTAENSLRHNLRFHTALGSMGRHVLKQSVLGRPAGFLIAHPANPTYIADQRIGNLAKHLDSSNPKIVAALDATISILANAKERCRQQGADLTVLIIPTRETVYFSNQGNRDAELPGPLNHIAQAEYGIRERLTNAFAQQQIGYVDLLASMAAALDAKTQVYANHNECHPLPSGYATYAAAVSQHLSRSTTATN